MSDTHRKGNNIIYGRKPILDALAEGKRFERIFLRDNLSGEFEKEIRALCKTSLIPLKKVPAIKLDKLTRKRNHQGIVGIGSIVEYQGLSDVIPHIYENGESPLLVLLDNIQDVRNIGAIARSAETLGAQGIILSGNNAGMITHDSLKASAGALSRINVSREKNTLQTIAFLKDHGIKTIGSSVRAEKSVFDLSLTAPICLVLGSEGPGLQKNVEDECDYIAKIPQIGRTDSLNVSVACGIILYEIQRQTFVNE